MNHWSVAHVMTNGAISVQRDTPFREIVDILELHNINAVPVVDNADHVVGLVSSADLIPKIEFAGQRGPVPFERPRTRRGRAKSTGTAAGDVMTVPVVTVHRDTSVVQAARAMDEGHLKRLPVVDDTGRLVGIVSRGDLLKVFLRSDAQIRDEIVDDLLKRMWIAPSELDVRVEAAVVTLDGELEQRSLVDIVARLVRAVDGVVDVVNRMTFRSDDTVNPEARYYRNLV